MPRVTGLRERPGGKVVVELDGTAWRTLPVDAVVRAELVVGLELDRARARVLRRELRRAGALRVATKALARRDYSAQALDARLERAGVGSAERREAVEALERAGALDDARYAWARAAALAERGFGDAAIRWDLERQGLPADLVAEAVAALEPETLRAAALVSRRGPRRTSAAFLARRGFGEDAIESEFGADDNRG